MTDAPSVPYARRGPPISARAVIELSGSVSVSVVGVRVTVAGAGVVSTAPIPFGDAVTSPMFGPTIDGRNSHARLLGSAPGRTKMLPSARRISDGPVIAPGQFAGSSAGSCDQVFVVGTYREIPA